MKYIDLHVHSLFSDGTCTPEELVDKASAQGLVAFALTDHDTVGGVDRALAAAKDKHLQVIPGVELSCEYQITPTRSKEIHILGYNIDWKQKELLDTLEAVAKERDDRNKKMCKNLQKAGYPIDYDSLIERFGDTILTRAHFARYLKDHGYVQEMSDAFSMYIGDSCPCFVLSPEKGIELIKNAGGLPVLAHPLLYKMSVTELHHLLDELCSYGLRGIEAMYSRNRGNDEAFVRKLANDYGLFITGGTDYHGANKPDLDIGTGEGNLRVPVMLLENLK